MRTSRQTLLALTGALLTAGALHADASLLSVSNEYNFREFRGGDEDRPVNWRAGDELSFGLRVVDPATGRAPTDAIVKARNSGVPGQEVSLTASSSGNGDYFGRLPYTDALGAGNWVVDIITPTGTRTVSLPTYGSGPQAGPHPLVENLEASGSGQNWSLDWTLPPGVSDQTAAGGNINRLRARLHDSNGRQLVDDRRLGLPTDQESLQATNYVFDPGVFTHNGLYVGQVMVEGYAPYGRSRAIEGFDVTDAVTDGGVAVGLRDGFSDVIAFRDHRGKNSTSFTEGDRFSLSINVDESTDTYVHARSVDDPAVAMTMGQAREANRAFEFSSGVAWDDRFSGEWDIVVDNGAERQTFRSEAFNASDKVELARGISIEFNDLTPTLNWELPSGSFDSVQVGLFDDVTDNRLSVFGPQNDQLFATLAGDATSYTFNPGELEFGRQYVARIVINETVDNGRADHSNLVNRSVTFVNFTPVAGNNSGSVFLPTTDSNGTFNFDFDVNAGEEVVIDPFVSVGYDYAIGSASDPLFGTVTLPDVGDGIYDLWLFDDAGVAFDTGINLLDGVSFDFTSLVTFDFVGAGVTSTFDYSNGAERFRVLGIETSAGVDPLDVTAFMTTLSFTSSGRFTGTMTPLTVFIPDATVSEPHVLALIGSGLLLAGLRGRRRARRQD